MREGISCGESILAYLDDHGGRRRAVRGRLRVVRGDRQVSVHHHSDTVSPENLRLFLLLLLLLPVSVFSKISQGTLGGF